FSRHTDSGRLLFSEGVKDHFHPHRHLVQLLVREVHIVCKAPVAGGRRALQDAVILLDLGGSEVTALVIEDHVPVEEALLQLDAGTLRPLASSGGCLHRRQAARRTSRNGLGGGTTTALTPSSSATRGSAK